ncbi:hypothetical protein CAZ18_20570 [Pseudomonas aeruginosa]|nr:hypothetical protein CAY89_21260 [Pseudomonas aeruginosa]OTI37115.1 hypothetical protein CAY97_20280 [Pseudomonas aeruginosa]OTI43270.1 hypothetical protein CAZ18_20570 [Pseudomonas aeruginosa]RAP64129.1 hypothetical protein AXW85_29570 [Pseudomonas aeruginosa]RPM68039.1 hypothetical protein IPC1290_29410 [Pseudomonas aeruginosa]
MGEAEAIYVLALKVICFGSAGLVILLFTLGILEAFLYRLEGQRNLAVKNNADSEDGGVSARSINIDAE